VATAYARNGDTLLVDLVFTESPHRLHLTLEAGTFTARWHTEPLGDKRPSSIRRYRLVP
jgi:hypothetical protein